MTVLEYIGAAVALVFLVAFAWLAWREVKARGADADVEQEVEQIEDQTKDEVSHLEKDEAWTEFEQHFPPDRPR